jgi:hypothetical protein
MRSSRRCTRCERRSVRDGSSITMSSPRWREGEKEARGLLLMTTDTPRHVRVGFPGQPGLQHALLRFLTCGSVDDGKSTLIGRLLYEMQSIPSDDLLALSATAVHSVAPDEHIDFALLVDGLQAEREQCITIDVSVPVPRDGSPFLDRGGYAGARAVHAQHGHWSLELRGGRDLDGRAQRRAGSDSPAQLYLLPVRGSGTPSWPSTRLTWWITQASAFIRSSVTIWDLPGRWSLVSGYRRSRAERRARCPAHARESVSRHLRHALPPNPPPPRQSAR